MKVLTEKQVERKFKSINKKLLKQIGHTEATNNFELDNIGKDLFGSKWLGVYMSNSKIPKTPKQAYFIINVDKIGQRGSHWMGVYRTTNNTYYMFDSFGRRSDRLVPSFTRGKIIIDSDYDADQHDSTDICGSLCLSWLVVVRDYGIRNALKI